MVQVRICLGMIAPDNPQVRVLLHSFGHSHTYASIRDCDIYATRVHMQHLSLLLNTRDDGYLTHPTLRRKGLGSQTHHVLHP